VDEITFLRQTIRVYRATFSEIHELVRASEARVAGRIIEELVKGQRRLEKLKVHAPASLLPDAARKREGLQSLEEFA
jgi:hypothetical protein